VSEDNAAGALAVKIGADPSAVFGRERKGPLRDDDRRQEQVEVQGAKERH
jgi:hypothetical protein